jgi:hypothetical protein
VLLSINIGYWGDNSCLERDRYLIIKKIALEEEEDGG